MTPIKIVCLCYLAAILVILRRQKGANYSFSTSSLVERSEDRAGYRASTYLGLA